MLARSCCRSVLNDAVMAMRVNGTASSLSKYFKACNYSVEADDGPRNMLSRLTPLNPSFLHEDAHTTFHVGSSTPNKASQAGAKCEQHN